ncbi:DNA-binding SARP family transcriptional activator [Halanaerobium saccharolyticum]|uniref:DNA-binding SARP family transcriptional activator n=1 Tax=Halanaerobium saccharolyticum TaxID=43595 RepID=A0A4R6LI81_9FIRM|nr:BTAD domain-containing protein [Halanaerobium saccharolyticum]TDO83337.1 DNA-binding SARP family transcriptional activator [Halanaerobium saccharolyticum]
MSELEKISFYGLGPFYYEYQGKRFDGSSWVSKRALYLLMYLLLAKDRNVAAEELVDVFWEESDLNDGKNKLYNTIYLLRKSLARDGIPKDIVESKNGGYSLNDAYPVKTDWNYFEKNAKKVIKGEELSLSEVEDLLSLYRGDFFPPLRYEGWTEIHREDYRELYLNLIENFTEKLFQEQRYRDAVNYLHKGIEYDPYRENFYLFYIKALVKLGRVAEAINSYKKCERILKEELDVFPGRSLKKEYHRIRMSQDLTEDIEVELNESPILGSGAMLCEMMVFKKIYELEIRHVKRLKKEFVLMTIDFNNVELKLPFQKAADKIGSMLRTGDVICVLNKKVYILLRDMSLVNSGIIMNRFNKFCEELELIKKPSIDIREVN